MKLSKSFKKGLLGLTTLALVATFASCAESQRDPEGTASEGAADSTFVFAASSDPLMLDPALASDGETFRVARQMFEGLVGAAPGTTDVEPLLATEWETRRRRQVAHLHPAEGVKFHDGTDFNAEAVCANFERWYNWTGLNQNENISYYYGKLFRGFKTGKTGGIYDSCEAASPTEATIKLSQPVRGVRAGHDAAGLLDAEPHGDGGVRRRQHHRHAWTTPGSRSTPPSTRPAPDRTSSTSGSATRRSR